MQLVEQHIIKSNEWREWCIKAKDLYNQTLYYWRQSIFGKIQYFNEYEILGLYREFNEPVFVALPSHCGQEVIKNLFKNIKSWQKARKEYQSNPNKFNGKPKFPKYKKELSILGFNNCQVRLKNGYMHFPKSIGIAPMKTKIPNGSKLGSARVIPKSNHFVVEFVYEVLEQSLKADNGNYLGIDIGLNNLATCVSNVTDNFIINGKPLKAINNFYNKRRKKLQSKLSKNKYISKRIDRLTFRRNTKIKNYIHHASKFVVEEAKKYNVTKIIIGKNEQWKQNINIGKKNNRDFASIPHAIFIEQIKYKAKLVGIETVLTQEAYTSKCSALDFEPIQKHEIYVGKRVKRGLFRTKGYKYINSDVNGALNIVRIVAKNTLNREDFVRSAVIAPKRILPFKQKVA